MLTARRVVSLAASLAVMVPALAAARPQPARGAPAAQDAAARFTGAVIGSPAGAFATHDIAAPAGARVTVVLRQTNAPCLVGRKDGENRGDLYVEADLQPGRAGPSVEQAACRQGLSFVATGRRPGCGWPTTRAGSWRSTTWP